MEREANLPKLRDAFKDVILYILYVIFCYCSENKMYYEKDPTKNV